MENVVWYSCFPQEETLKRPCTRHLLCFGETCPHHRPGLSRRNLGSAADESRSLDGSRRPEKSTKKYIFDRQLQKNCQYSKINFSGKKIGIPCRNANYTMRRREIKDLHHFLSLECRFDSQYKLNSVEEYLWVQILSDRAQLMSESNFHEDSRFILRQPC